MATTPARALSKALPSNVGSVSAGSSYGVTSSSPSTSMPGTSSDRIRRSSSSFFGFREARKTWLTR